MNLKRWVRKDRRIYDFSHCTYCGTAWGAFPNRQCPPATCLVCRTTQCLGNGLGRGSCAVCLIGMLPGWSGTDRTCGYKSCAHRAIAFVGGQVKIACNLHLARNGKATYIAKQLAERGVAWEEV